MPKSSSRGLTAAQVQSFIDDGFVKIDHAFSSELGRRCRDELWADIGLSPDEPDRWLQPIIRVASKATPPFVAAANTSLLHEAYDQLVGEGRWIAPQGLGTFPIRFPSPQSPGDDGWHVDMSFGDASAIAGANFMEWRVNVKSSGRALLMLFLLSDVGPEDAPTRIRKGSHFTIARELLPHGEAGVSLGQLSANGYSSTNDCEIALATGAAGTVYLCHPFIVHAAQPHRGKQPRFMAQPPLLPAEPLRLERTDRDHSPVERAIREGFVG